MSRRVQIFFADISSSFKYHIDISSNIFLYFPAETALPHPPGIKFYTGARPCRRLSGKGVFFFRESGYGFHIRKERNHLYYIGYIVRDSVSAAVSAAMAARREHAGIFPGTARYAGSDTSNAAKAPRPIAFAATEGA
jgi:hypothetical protein